MRQIRCVKCGSATIQTTTEDIVNYVPCHKCVKCGEIHYTDDVAEKLEKLTNQKEDASMNNNIINLAQEKLTEAVYNGEYLPNIDEYTYYIAVEESTGEIVSGDLCGQNNWTNWHDGYTEIGRVTGKGYGETENDKEAYYSQLILYGFDDGKIDRSGSSDEYRSVISFEGKHFEEW